MRTIVFSLFALIVSIQSIEAQQLSLEDIPAMVTLVDEQINLNDYQEKELTAILTDAYYELVKIQKLQKTDIEKLKLMTVNRNTTRNRLQVVLETEQMKAYESLLDGNSKMGSVQTVEQVESGANQSFPSGSNSTTTASYDGSVASIADQLGFTGSQKSEFIMAYEQQERDVKQALSGEMNIDAGVSLLTSILTTDFKIIDIGGRDKYEQYFNMRSSGQLGGSANQDVEITQVYQFYDLKEALGLDVNQTKGLISLILESEGQKKMVRQQYQGSERNARLKQLETDVLSKLQQVLSQEQIQKLAQLMGR